MSTARTRAACSWKIKMTDNTDMMADRIPRKARTIRDRWLYACDIPLPQFARVEKKEVSCLRWVCSGANSPALLKFPKVRRHGRARERVRVRVSSRDGRLPPQHGCAQRRAAVERPAARSEHVMGSKPPDPGTHTRARLAQSTRRLGGGGARPMAPRRRRRVLSERERRAAAASCWRAASASSGGCQRINTGAEQQPGRSSKPLWFHPVSTLPAFVVSIKWALSSNRKPETMGRKKIQISRILDQRNRQVTFTKRKFGLMKKAYELSVLCDCEIALIIFNSTNRLFQYASTDMDKVLLKYTEYSEPHESRTNTDILETLRRKGLGLDGSELDSEEGAQVAADKYPLSEGMDLSVARQRFYAPSLLPPEAQFLVSAENGFPSPAGSGAGSGAAAHRSPAFKSLSSRTGAASPAGPHAHTAFMSPHSGIGYSVFSHGNLNRSLDVKSPPHLNLGGDGLRGEAGGPSRSNHSSRGLLYQGLHSGSSVVAMSKAGLLGHSLGGYSLSSPGASDYSQPGFYHSVSLQRGAVNPWQPAQPPQQPHGPHGSPGMTSGGCCYPAQTCSSASPHLLSLSIKSERSSPEHMSSPTSPPLHHLRQHSPSSNSDSAHHTPPETHSANERKEFPKAGYAQEEEEAGQMEMGWQR
ncbi:myocyte-specific enhancer factor 2B [Betta splendens]|uniref:Myocyte-specific enhancer factor 2B n=2 Tax=Clupeocephala TaxID=186625 RepID=A0A9W2XPP6_BETSP|nr:myocyte-specific enhancer factor 2B [Betta splendens]